MKIIKPSYEIITPLNGNEILKHIEQVARTCYKSEDKITDGSAEKMVRALIKGGHTAMLEHYSFTVKFICDRGVTHEIVRHRLASYAQESTRYCVAGDTKIYFKNPRQKFTISELYNKIQESTNGSWKRLNAEQYNESTGELQYVHIKNVFKNGKKECIQIKTKLGYELICTLDHEILNKNGYIKAKDFKLGDKIYVNGTDLLYQNYDWLYNQYITQNKTYPQIAKEFNFKESTVKKWGQKLNIPKKAKSYFNVGRIPWNKGTQCAEQIETLRKYHHCGRRNDKILKIDTKCYQKYCKDRCEICGNTDELNVHHIDKNRQNNYPDNLMTVCISCHQRIHSQNLQVAFEDEIISIENVGIQDVYDIEMDSEFHNYVANGVVVHNCNYSKGKFGSELTFIKPCFFDENSREYRLWCEAMQKTEDEYLELINSGATPEQARDVLPTSIKTELVMTTNLTEWRHFFNLRAVGTTGKPHPQMTELAIPLLEEVKSKIPVVFDDIIVNG